MKSYILSIFLGLTGIILSAQTYEISGTVSDASGMPLPGVSVIVKNSTRGTSTDFDGNFIITPIEKGEILEFSYMGFATKDITITNGDILNVKLEEDAEALDEVVVVGYGSQKRKDITGAVSVVSSEAIEELKPTDASIALQGTTSGVSVNAESGSPGGDINILIRGVSSNIENGPLVIIDGYEGSLNSINPEDIASMSVLKDAQAAIYGIKGANGVILVTTKTGKKNTPPKISYSGYTGLQETTKTLNYLNATEYALLLNESYAVNGQTIPYPVVDNIGLGTNWQDEIFKNAFVTNHNISVSGGGENVTYYIGANRLDQEGIIAPEKSNYVRNNIKISLGVDLSEKFKVSTNVNYFNNARKSINENGLGSVLFNALNYSPIFTTEENDLNGLLGNEVINPLAQIENTFNNYGGNSLEGNFQLDYKPLEGLKVTSRIGFKTYSDDSKDFSPVVFHGAGKVFNTTRSSVNQNKNTNNSYTWETFFNYNKTFLENHNTTFTVGTSAQKDWGNGLSGTGYDIPSNSWDFADIALADGSNNGAQTSNSYVYDSRLTSYFGRLQYNYNGKYLLSAMIRRDASSDFSLENRVDYFKSATLGWKISDEAFFENVKSINFLKLRGSYGTLGSNVGENLYRALLNGEGTYVFDNTITNGDAMGLLANPNAKWEVAKKLDIGIDMKLFDYKFEIVADWFREDREDLLIGGYPVSGILGTNGPGGENPTVNAGTTRNTGVELLLGYKGNISDNLKIGINYNITYVDGEVISTNGVEVPRGGNFSVGQTALRPSSMDVGQALGAFYGLQTDGIFQNQAEVEAHASQGGLLGIAAKPGDLRFKDLNGDGEITLDDRTYIGKPQADFYTGFNLNLTYKNFDFTTYLYAEIGKEMIRNYERDQANVNKLDMYLDRWHGEGTTNSTPRVTTEGTNNRLFSDFFVEDASFLRIQNIQLGYSFPSVLIDKIGVTKLRIYTSVKNAYTFTEYKGYDPAATTGEPIGGGIDYGFYPISRQYNLGLNVTF